MGALEFAFDTVTANLEDSTFYVLRRQGGNALSRAYGFRSLGNFNTLFTITPTAARTITLQDADQTLVARTTTDTMTNKTLDTPLFVTGTGTGTFKGSGLQNSQNGSVGTDAVITEKDLYTYTLPANSLAVNGQTIELYAWGTTAANTNTKTVRLYFGGVVVMSNDVTGSPNNVNWYLYAKIARTGSATELSIGQGIVGTTNQTATFQALTADTTSTITVKVTGQNGTANASDIVGRVFLVKYGN